jgi:hypothetical protein
MRKADRLLSTKRFRQPTRMLELLRFCEVAAHLEDHLMAGLLPSQA